MLVSLGCVMCVLLCGQPQPKPAPAPAKPPGETPAATPLQEPAADDPALLKRLEKIDTYADRITDLTARFEQRRFTSLLKKPMVSSGQVRLKGQVSRWDTTAPAASVLVIDADSLKLYYPAQHSLEIYAVGTRLARLTANPLPRLRVVREEFSIRACKATELEGVTEESAGSAVALLLVPKGEELKKHVRQVRVLLDEPAEPAPPKAETSEKEPARSAQGIPWGIARQVEITDADGDRTVVTFKDVKVNAGLADADLELKAPEGTKVSRPLEGRESGSQSRDKDATERKHNK